jgi:hypothetical protein
MTFPRWAAPAWVAVSFGAMAGVAYYAKPGIFQTQPAPATKLNNKIYNKCMATYFRPGHPAGIFAHMICDEQARHSQQAKQEATYSQQATQALNKPTTSQALNKPTNQETTQAPLN